MTPGCAWAPVKVLPMPADEVENRQGREEAFWDQAFGGEEFHDRPQRRFYSVTDAAFGEYAARIEALAVDADVLEYGCGPGSKAFMLARQGARVTGIDISSVAIERGREQAEREGLSDRVTFEVMDAERLDLEDSTFDLVCGTGILHHIDLESAYRELGRVLRPGGTAVFVEPMGHNRAIEAYRRRTPDEHTVDEHPLKVTDLESARRNFDEVQWRYYTLLALAAVPFRNARGFDGLVRTLDAVDRGLFRLSKTIAKQAWLVLIELSEPKP